MPIFSGFFTPIQTKKLIFLPMLNNDIHNLSFCHRLIFPNSILSFSHKLLSHHLPNLNLSRISLCFFRISPRQVRVLLRLRSSSISQRLVITSSKLKIPFIMRRDRHNCSGPITAQNIIRHKNWNLCF